VTVEPVTDESFAVDERYSRFHLRDTPVSWWDYYGGRWIVSGYDEGVCAAKDPETFASRHDLPNGSTPYAGVMVPSNADPRGADRGRPARVRLLPAPAQPAVLAGGGTGHAPRGARLRDLVHRPPDRVRPHRPVPRPREARARHDDHATHRAAARGRRNHRRRGARTGRGPVPPEGAVGVLFQAHQRGDRGSARRAPRRPRVPLLAAEIDGRKFNDLELVELLLHDGHRRHGDDRAADPRRAVVFRGASGRAASHHRDPSQLPDAIEEFLRYLQPGAVPVAYRDPRRVPWRAGHKAGDRVVLGYAAANRDPKAFDRPTTSSSTASPTGTSRWGTACTSASVGRWARWRRAR